MVKGTTRQVIVIKPTDTKLYEQAIFLMKEDGLEHHGVSERQFLEEAQKLCESYCMKPTNKGAKIPVLRPLLWGGVGAVLTGFAWLLSLL